MAKTDRRRRLEDLYQTRTDVTVDDGSGEPITVTVVKLNKVDMASLVRRCNGAKATVLVGRNDPESETYKAEMVGVADIDDRTQLADLVIMADLSKAQMSIEAEVA